MFDALRRLVSDSVPGTPGAHSRVYPHDVRIAACALLVELSCADGTFSDAEQHRIMESLQRHFGVDEAGARELLAEAAAANRDAVDHFVFTRQVVKEYSLAQRIVLAELMWQVVLADGLFDEQEAYLIRKLANLLELEPAFLSQARRSAE
ncbi:TerB family tellurite resistance protein [Gemmatimonas sp.]|uniref:tellurite resistance TerB family protein n=1 Tax=Gemmatimonas sp. TaxID=1962908 RepID=UPI00391C4CE0